MAHVSIDPFSQARTFVQTGEAALPELDRWQQIGQEEVDLVAAMTARNELSGGTPVVRAFEQEWREWTGLRYALTVINGTSALYSAYFGLGIGPGDEVICPVNTWICSIAPAVLLGARPVFCDIDPDSLLLDVEDVRAKITENTRCICAVHLWGNVCDMDALLAVGKEHGIPVLEDCSHSHGACFEGRITGTLGAVGCWSLQGSKAVSAGEGGVLATDDVEIFERACLLGQVNRVAGIDLVGAKYEELQPLGLGIKLRAHPLGIGLAQIQFAKLPELNRRRREYIETIEAGLADIPGLRPVTVDARAERGGFYGFPVIHDPDAMGKSTQDFIDAVNAKGLHATPPPYPNLHELPLFAKGFDLFTRNRGPLCPDQGYAPPQPGDYPQAELAQRRTLFLPRLTDPTPEAPSIVLDVLRSAAGEL